MYNASPSLRQHHPGGVPGGAPGGPLIGGAADTRLHGLAQRLAVHGQGGIAQPRAVSSAAIALSCRAQKRPAAPATRQR